MDLDLWDCFGRKKNLSCIRGNTVNTINLRHQISVIILKFRGAVVERFERLGYGAESLRKIVRSRLGFVI